MGDDIKPKASFLARKNPGAVAPQPTTPIPINAPPPANAPASGRPTAPGAPSGPPPAFKPKTPSLLAARPAPMAPAASAAAPATEPPPRREEPVAGAPDADAKRAEAESILMRGLDCYGRNEHELALAAYNEAIQVDPTFAMAYNNRGMILIDMERYQDAMNSLYNSIRYDPNYGEAYNNLGFVLRRLGDNNIQAAAAYRKFLDLEPEVDEASRITTWINSVLAENGLQAPPPLILPAQQDEKGPVRHDEPPPKIKKMAAWEAAAGDMETAAPINVLGEISNDAPTRTLQSDPEPQQTDVSKPPLPIKQPMSPVKSRLPDPPRLMDNQNQQVALVEKSLDEFANGNLDDALNLANEAVGLDSQCSEAHTALGKILVRQEKLKEGIEQLELAIQLAPLDPAPYFVLGFTLRAMERNVEAAEIYETYLRLMPDAIDAPKMRQWITRVKGISESDAPPAHDDEGFIDNDPIVSDTDKVYQVARDRFQTRPAGATIENCERILTDAPDHVRTRILLGRAYMRNGEFDKAVEAFGHALEQRPDCAEALYFIGRSFEKSGNSPHALSTYRRYVDENPRGPRVEKLRAWFKAHGAAETGKGASQQIQCEWCLRFFDASAISKHESKATCNGCLTLMGSTPIQDASALETEDSLEKPSKSGRLANGGSIFRKLVLLGAGTAAALVALGYYTPYLDPYLKMAGIVKKKPATITRVLPPVDPGLTTPGTTATATTKVPIHAPLTLSPNFDGTKVKIANAPERDFSVFSRWTWKPELAGVEELDQSIPGWKMEPYIKNQPPGMTVEGDTIVWTSETKDFDALKAGEKFTVELTIKGRWIGPEGAQKDLFTTKKTFSVTSQFGYDLGPEMDIGMAADARNIDLLSVDADGDGMRDMIVTHGSLNQGAIRTVFCGPDVSKQSITMAEGGRYSSACTFPLNGKESAGVLAANWQTGEVKLFWMKGGRFEAGPLVKFPPGIVSVVAMEVGKGKTAVAALSSAAGTLSVAVYEQGKDFSVPASVAMTGGGGNGHVLAWNSADLGPGFLAITPLAEEPLRFLPWANGEWNNAGTAVRSILKDEGLITAAAPVACAQNGSHKLALVLGGKASRLILLEEKAGKFNPVGAKVALPGPGLGLAVCDFNKDGCDDVFVVTRDEVCFYFLNDAGAAIAGPHFSNPGMLGPVVLLGFKSSARPDIAVLNENKKARVFKAVGADHGAVENAHPKADAARLVGLPQ